MDSSCAIIALDRGAADILKYHREGSASRESAYAIDRNILQVVHNAGISGSSLPQRVRVGIGEFTCRIYLLESRDLSMAEPIVGLLLERQIEERDAIHEIADEYGLTKREEQALRGLAAGLTTKALAIKMNIRPSTLRALLRLIKIKMGMTTRAGIVVKVLEKKQLLQGSDPE